jgi:hypothetical protein
MLTNRVTPVKLSTGYDSGTKLGTSGRKLLWENGKPCNRNSINPRFPADEYSEVRIYGSNFHPEDVGPLRKSILEVCSWGNLLG